ncbi:hypothetical protein [Sulfitobacter noctilucae]|uniref:hypothetical protein n=1 Tax=Sulfitobacter noctilucae TaxID=1342302 RepID=UPI0004686EA2|nr:hypothetical protein [Sulfitobacter noctilucae]
MIIRLFLLGDDLAAASDMVLEERMAPHCEAQRPIGGQASVLMQQSLCDLQGGDFAKAGVMSLEKRIKMYECSQGNLSNREQAIL